MTGRANPKKLRQRLKWLWDNRTSPVGDAPGGFARWRYIPLSVDGGAGWGVFDKLHDRFLEDAELVALPLEQLQTATHLS